jgi:hypothetical protein
MKRRRGNKSISLKSNPNRLRRGKILVHIIAFQPNRNNKAKNIATLGWKGDEAA